METQDHGVHKLFHRGDFPVFALFWKGTITEKLPLYHHPELEFQFIYQGEGQYFIGSRQYRFRKNSVLIVHGNETHTFVKENGLLTEKICLTFSPKVLRDRQSAMEIISRLKGTNYLALPDRKSARMRLILEQIMEERKQNEVHWKEVVVDLLEMLLLILDRCLTYPSPGPDEEDPFIKKVVEYLEGSFAEKLSLKGVAEHFSVSPYNLSKMFKQKTGIGFKQYLIRCRVAEAKRLLEQTDYKIARVALEAGFCELTTFNREFLSVTGIRPSLFRKLCL